MSGFASPDWPAYVCYGIVLVVGVIVARATLNDRLAAYPDRWAFADTWILFFAHVAVPIALFWFLDYTGALRDTSLFAALVVAFGYRQVFAGRVQGLGMPGQASALWQPFEAWVGKVADRIATRNKQYRDRFDEIVRTYLAQDPDRLTRLRALVFERTKDLAAVQAALASLETDPPPPGAPTRRAEALLRELRVAEPENYGYLLHRRQIIPWSMYWRWLEKGESKLITLALGAAAIVAVVVLWWSTDREQLVLRYHQWRFLKPNSSELDRFRSREYLRTELSSGALHQRHLIPLLRQLRFASLPADGADAILRLVVDYHSRPLNAIACPELIESLRTENADVRLRIQRALLAIRDADYPDVAPAEELIKWVPKAEDTAADIDRFVRLWRRWWTEARARGTAPAPSSGS